MHNQGWLSPRLGGRAGGGFVRLNQHFYTLRALNPPLPLQGGDNVRLLGAYSLDLGSMLGRKLCRRQVVQ